MALRVLLADESTTIKKVMQLALQDFAVEVKAVHVGIDVAAVARQFQPDIIFADVLLQKKNGYEVCSELKADSELNSIPVVLMWSSFMDLDESLAANCGADRRLEKPFDIENLRQLLLELVPKTHTQRLAHFLKFPASFSDPLRKEEASKSAAPPATPPKVAQPATSSAQMAKPPQQQAPAAKQAPPITAQKPVQQPPPQQKVQPTPAQASNPQDASEKAGGWNMDSFEDISSFENELHAVESHHDNEHEQAHRHHSPLEVPELDASAEDFAATDELGLDAPNASHAADGDDDEDEVFSELRLQDQTHGESAHDGPSQDEPPAFDNLTLTQEIPLMPSSPQQAAATEESDDPWSHQDLSRFKVDLPPVTASNPEHGIDLEIPETDHGLGELSKSHPQTLRSYEPDPELQDGDIHGDIHGDTQGYDQFSFGGHHPQSQRRTPLHPDEIAQAEDEVVPNFELEADNLELSTDGEEHHHYSERLVEDEDRTLQIPRERAGSQQISHEQPRAQQTQQPAGRRPSRQAHDSEDFSGLDAAKIPQLSPERLEQIIRAQAREIVESVVRKIVPDLATDIIREELQRLLEDTATFEGRADSPSTSRGRNR